MRHISVSKLKAPKAVWEHVTFAASESEPGVEYEIKRRNLDGHLGCACLAYRFKRGEKTCKHLSAFAQSPNQQHPVQSLRVDGELFTFRRRSIAVGALP